LLCSSCSDKSDFEHYFSATELELQETYKIDSISQYGFTDWTLEAYIRISEENEEIILNKMNKDRKYFRVDSKEDYYDNHFPTRDSVLAYIVGSTYYYRLYKKRLSEDNSKMVVEENYTYEIKLDTVTNRLFFQFDAWD